MVDPVKDMEKSFSDMQIVDSCRRSGVQGYNKLLQWDANPSANYPWIPNVQEHARHLILHPILGMTLAELEHDGTVVRVYGPPLEWIVLNGPRFPLLQENLRVVVPQLRCAPDASRRGWIQKPPVLFFVWGRLGVRLPDALKGEVKGMDNQGGFPLGDCNAISIRMHLPGYESSTEVEKTLKEQWESNEREKARSMRVSTKINGIPITNSGLAKEVSKRVQWHIWDLENNKDLFPFDSRVGEQWRLGQGRMRFEHMVITKLDNITSGSWSPVIYIG